MASQGLGLQGIFRRTGRLAGAGRVTCPTCGPVEPLGGAQSSLRQLVRASLRVATKKNVDRSNRERIMLSFEAQWSGSAGGGLGRKSLSLQNLLEGATGGAQWTVPQQGEPGAGAVQNSSQGAGT